MEFSAGQMDLLISALSGDGLSIDEMGPLERPVEDEPDAAQYRVILHANRVGLFMGRFPESLIHHAKLGGAEAKFQKLRDLHPERIFPNLPGERIFRYFKNDVHDADRFLHICADLEALKKKDSSYNLLQKAKALQTLIQLEYPKLINIDLSLYIRETVIPNLDETITSLREQVVRQIHRDVDVITPLPEEIRPKSPNFQSLQQFFLAIKNTPEEEAVKASLQQSDQAETIVDFISTLLPNPTE